MNTPFEYRAYVIDREDGWFIAKPLDGEPGEIGSRHLLRVMKAIDALWATVDSGSLPQWFNTEDLINLDQPVRDRLKLGAFRTLPARIASTFDTNASKVDPTKLSKIILTVLAVVGIATPVAMGMQQLVAGSEPAIIFTLAVTAIALQFGRWPAIGASLVVMVLYNFSFQAPVMTPSLPTLEECAYTLINLVVSVALPWLLSPRWLTSIRKASVSDHTQGTVSTYP
ncbi:DUF4118 domain-containing protein [Bradyrhizobium ottawaense]|uniref:DUF4118 domain-containing protein n=1 Tax=Bradyrhizobium ottawaense TaxID=931866 RepID=UPI000B87CD9F|nr:DUF4118 domain-containing protein [Bradyrhizobium ottawaense]